MGGIHCRGPSSEIGTATFDPSLQHSSSTHPSNVPSDLKHDRKASEQTTRVSWPASSMTIGEPWKSDELRNYETAKIDSEAAEEGSISQIDLDYKTYILIRLPSLSKAVYEVLKPFAYVSLSKAQPLVALSNGAVYFGDTDTNLVPQGLGLRLEADLTLLEGNWNAGLLHGKGLQIYPNGDYYEGCFAHGEIAGKGKFVHIGGAAYEGDWKDSRQHGYGIEHWVDGSTYEGDFVTGKKQGFGRFHWFDKSTYEGYLVNNQLEGHGKYVWNDGKSYEGHWSANQMTGKGVFLWSDGKRYEGEFLDGRKSGYGELIRREGKRCAGFWHCGKLQFSLASD